MTVSLNSPNTKMTPNFKGSMKRTEQGNPYYSTNSGTKIGTGVAAFELLGGAGLIVGGNYLEKMAKKIPTLSSGDKKLIGISSEIYKKLGKLALCFAPVYLGCGMIVDYIRNNKAKQTADFIKQVGVKNAIAQDPNINISRRNRPYLDTNSGGKYGALLGAIVSPITGLATYSVLDNLASKTSKLSNMPAAPKIGKAPRIIGNIVIGALGGWLLGMWADHNSNKAAEKYS